MDACNSSNSNSNSDSRATPEIGCTPAQLVIQLEEVVRNLPEACRRWSSYEKDWREDHRRTMKFLLNRIPDTLSALPDGSHWHTRLYLANQRLLGMRPMWEFIVR